MAQLFGLRQEQVDRILPLFPRERGVKRVDDRKVLSGSIPVILIRKGLRWVDALAAHGPHKTLYNRCRRWSDKGVFDLIFSELSAFDAAESPGSVEPPDALEPEVLMIDATDIKAHPMASSLNKGGAPRLIDDAKGGMTASSMGSATAKVVPCGSTCVRGNAVTSLLLICC